MIIYVKFTAAAKEKINSMLPELHKLITDEEKNNDGFTAWNVIELNTLVSVLRRVGFSGRVADHVITQFVN